MKHNFKILRPIVVLILISGFLSFAWAKDEVELTDIKIDNFNKQTTVNINTTRPIKFLFYKAENPLRLVIDFIGTSIYSNKPEKIIFKSGNIKEIQSIFYDQEEGFRGRLDALILKFEPNVTVTVKSSRRGITLNIQKAEALAKKSLSTRLKLAKARFLADTIAKDKRQKFGKDKGFIEISEKSDIQQKSFKPLKKSAFLSSTNYRNSLYDKSLKKELDEILNKQIAENRIRTPIISFTENKRYNWVMLTVVGAAFVSILLVTLIISNAEKQEKVKEDEIDELDEFFTEYQPYQLNQDGRGTQETNEILDKCLENRKFARFDLPQNSEQRTKLDIETVRKGRAATQAKNISLGGIGIELKKNVKLPSILQIELKLPDFPEANHIVAKVAWSKKKNEDMCLYGISFMMLTNHDEKRIRKYLMENFINR